MVYSVLLSVLHFKTSLLVDTDGLLKVFHQSAEAKWKRKTGVILFVAFCWAYFCILQVVLYSIPSGVYHFQWIEH